MTVRLYPRLPRHIARDLATSLEAATAVKANELASSTHPSAIFAPTGGRRVEPEHLDGLATKMRETAETFGFPAKPKTSDVSSFDARCAVLLHRDSGLSATEAAREEVWSFFGCVLAPDLVRWRWGGKTTPADRFLGGDRGLRNTFGRLWWRAELLMDEWWASRDAYELLFVLGEDEIVGYVERPRAVVNRLTAVSVAREVLEAHGRDPRINRIELHRDVMKRFLRRGAFVCYEALGPSEMRAAARGLVTESRNLLTRETRRAG